jgi:hypothetical protein
MWSIFAPTRTTIMLQRSEKYLAEAQKLARCGSWSWNVSSKLLSSLPALEHTHRNARMVKGRDVPS